MNRYAQAPVLGAIPFLATLVIAFGLFGAAHLTRSEPNLVVVSALSTLVWAMYELAMRVPWRTVMRALPLIIVIATMFTFAAACATLAWSWLADAWW